MASQDAGSVAITGGNISGISLDGNKITNAHIANSYLDSSPIGMSAPSTGHFTSLAVDTYEDFSTLPSNPTFSEGRLFYDNNRKALSY